MTKNIDYRDEDVITISGKFNSRSVERILGIKKPATEDTLQSIDSTLKRIEQILIQNQMKQSCKGFSEGIIRGITVNLPVSDLPTHDIQQEAKESKSQKK